MASENPFLQFIDRSYNQIKDAIAEKVGQYIPEITDVSDNSFFMRLISIWAGVAEMVGYYADRIPREFFLPTMKYYKSAVKLAKLFDYNIKTGEPQTYQVNVTLNQPHTSDIALLGVFQSAGGIKFHLSRYESDIIISAGSTQASRIGTQGVFFSKQVLGEADGSLSQTWTIPSSRQIQVLEIEDFKYNHVSNFNKVNEGTDGDYQFYKHAFVTSVDENKNTTITIGGGGIGFVPPAGTIVYYDYIDFENVNPIDIDIAEVISNPPDLDLPPGITLEITATNEGSFIVNRQPESLEVLKTQIPNHLRSSDRIITKQDLYDKIASIPYNFGQAAIEVGVDGVYIYVIDPNEGDNLPLAHKEYLLRLINESKQELILTQFFVRDPLRISVQIQVDVKILENYIFSDIQFNVQTQLTRYINDLHIGSPLAISNLYELVQLVQGVVYSDFLKLTYDIPVMFHPADATSLQEKSIIITDVNIPNTTSRVVKKYTIHYLNSNNFILLEGTENSGGTLLGTFTFGQLLPIFEGTLKISLGQDVYSVGDEWDFYIFPLNESINPPTISKFSLTLENITINAISS